MCGLKALTLHDNPGWDKSQPSHALESYAAEILVLDLLWLNCGPEQPISALTFRDFRPRKAHNHKGPISVVKKDLTFSHWLNRERERERGEVEASWVQIDPQMSRQVPSHQMSPSSWQLQDIQGVKYSYVQCTKGMYLSWSLHLRDATVGLPFVFRHSAFLGIRLWILKVCKCVHVKASKSTRC